MKFGNKKDWFFKKRFGMFVHWGLYALEAWHEQHQLRKNVPRAEYKKLVKQFNPKAFNPEEWLDIAEEAGMEYLTFTTKHLDGFCMWNTKQTNYNVMNTPFGKDILRMLSEACHKRKFPLCLYYALVDHHHINYPNQARSHEIHPEKGDQPDWEAYLTYVKKQIRELCENYGEIHGFWWDANCYEGERPDIYKIIHSLQPAAIINERGPGKGDFRNFEREYELNTMKKINVFTEPTEGCQSMGVESWGYSTEQDYFSEGYLTGQIDAFLAKGGNYLLNVGPKADGTIPEQDASILKSIGGWYKSVKESFEETIPVPHKMDNDNLFFTTKGNTLYVHLPSALNQSGISLRPLNILPKGATLLNTGEDVETKLLFLPSHYYDPHEYLVIRNFPVNKLINTALVIKLEFEELPLKLLKQKPLHREEIG